MNSRAAPESGDPPATKPGEDARERLLMAGLRLFAQQGYSKTSTRELAEAASVNVASISYYFGDKAGLYRAVFMEPLGSSADELARLRAAGPGLGDVLQAFYAGFLEPLKQGDVARLCMKLHFREMLEPTGLWQQTIEQDIRPLHDALAARLCPRFGLAAPDDDLQRLVICLAALGVHLHIGHDVTALVAPGLNDGAAALDLWHQRLVGFGLAMVQAELRRRGIPVLEEDAST
jgi:AcrR family transcriptional regulator